MDERTMRHGHHQPQPQLADTHHYAQQLVYNEAQAMPVNDEPQPVGIPLAPPYGYTEYHPYQMVQPSPMIQNSYPPNVRPMPPPIDPRPYYYDSRVGGYTQVPMVVNKDMTRPAASVNVIEDPQAANFDGRVVHGESYSDGMM